MVLIKNKQKKISINQKEIKTGIEKILKFLGYQDFDIGIWFTTNQTIKKYNKLYRNKNKVTDILSFPYHPKLKPGQKIKAKSPEEQNLGDIIISLEKAKQNAPTFKSSFKNHLKLLLVHGICHLLCFSHETEKEFKQMQSLEKKLLNLIA